MDWRTLFDKTILNRGYQYYLSGAVQNYERREQMISADVEGTERYEVEIDLTDEIVEMYCSCPYAEDGNNCKHMAAVLFHWKNEDGCMMEVKEKKASKKTVEQLVESADETTVKRFLVEALKGNKKLLSRFELALNTENSQHDMAQYKNRVDDTVEEYTDRSGYVSYRDAFDLCCELDNYITEDAFQMLKSDEYRKAFELTNYVLLSLEDTEIDDSDGGVSMLLDSAEQLWNEILERAPEEMGQYMFQWFTSQAEKHSVYYLDDCIENFLIENFSGDQYFSEKRKYVEKKIEKAEAHQDSWCTDYEVSHWVMCYIDLLKEAGEERDVIREYSKKYWKYADIRKYYAEDCIKHREVEEAIAVYKESIQLDAGWYGLVQEYSVKLKELYRANEMEQEYKLQLWELVTKHATGQLEFYRELKKLYTAEEWLTVREEIFRLLVKNMHLDDLYVEEKLYDRLLVSVLNAPLLFKTRQYAKVLKQEYPEELLQKYTEELNRMVRRASTRAQYQEWVKYLREMQDIKGGKKKVREIVEDWSVRYKNRPAMLEELRKL